MLFTVRIAAVVEYYSIRNIDKKGPITFTPRRYHCDLINHRRTKRSAHDSKVEHENTTFHGKYNQDTRKANFVT